MTIRSILLATAAVAGSAVPAFAAPQHHRAHPHAAPSATKAEIDELRSEIADLRQRLSEQTATQSQVQAQVATAQAQATTTETEVAAISAKQGSDTGTSQLAAAQDELRRRVEKDEHPDHIGYKGIQLTPGGFVELAGVYRDHNQESDIATGFNAIPFANSRLGHTSETRFTARQSRVSLLAEGNASKTVRLSMYGEFDFQGAAQTANSNESNSYNPRIRNLYGTIDWALAGGSDLHLLAGQNWSLVTMNAKGISPRNEVLPLGIDAQYVPGFAWTRTPQVRVTGDFMDKHLWLALSAENPQTTFYTTGTPAGTTAGSVGTAASLPGTLVYNGTGASGFNSANSLSINHIPDIVAKAAYETKIGKRTLHIEGFGLYREFSDRVTGGNYNTSGFSGGGSIAMQIVPGAIDAQFSGMAGKGIGRYGSSQLPDVTFRPDGSIAPLDEYMLLAGIITHPTKKLDVFGFAGEEVTSQRSYTTAAGLAYGYGNPLYTNTGCLTEGSSVCNGNTRSIRQVEVGFWQRLYQGSWGRAQVGAQYSHTSRHTFAGVGGAPEAEQDIGFLSFRYYPF